MDRILHVSCYSTSAKIVEILVCITYHQLPNSKELRLTKIYSHCFHGIICGYCFENNREDI